ncbi:MAG: hypothetical protein ACR65O_16110 [Methylomicrobium sp.]
MIRSKLITLGVRAAMAALFFLTSAVSAASFNYLYIEASEGNSSGGHAAIQFDDEVYHYQHVDPGLIRLFRQEKDEFHFLYRYLQNRPIHLSRIEVSEETLDILKDQFKWQFLKQEKQFKLLGDLRQDRIFIRHLLKKSRPGPAVADSGAASELRLKGVGLFYPEPGKRSEKPDSALASKQSQTIQRLRQKVEQRYGLSFLPRKFERIEAQIKALAPGHWPGMDSNLSDEKFPASVYSFTEKYSDAVTALFAVKALTDAPPLQSGTLLATNTQDFKISKAEKRGLERLRNDLETNLIEALDSSRPDWGYAVLVNLARYMAIDASLESGFWVFIDDFAENSEWSTADQYREHQSLLRILISDARKNLNQIRQSAASRQRLTEAEYSQLEMAANRYNELLKSEQHRDFRFNGEKALPAQSIGLSDAPLPDLAQAQLTAALSELDAVEHRLNETLKQRYRYNLISRNCVTELFNTIDQALLVPYSFKDQLADSKALTIKESQKRLGGYVDILYNFIPFVSYRSVQNRYRVSQSRDLDSYRSIELARLKAGQNSLIAALRESNILSSRLYKHNPDDALFVFFTDDQPLLRPLFGLANTAAGIGQSVYGIFSWPLDSGKNLKSGATGILMSLPELFFFNMRKGSYKYLSFNRLADADITDD